MLLVGALAWEEPDLKISNRNILLPVPQCEACRKVTYRLTARGGCYAWEISNPAVLELQEMRAIGEAWVGRPGGSARAVRQERSVVAHFAIGADRLGGSDKGAAEVAPSGSAFTAFTAQR